MGFAVGIVLLWMGSLGMAWYYSGEYHIADLKQKQVEAQVKIDEQAAVIIKEANNKITDMQAAFEAGKEQGKVVEKTIVVRGAADVQRFPVFQNTQCVLPSQSLALLNAARGSLRSGVLPAETVLPATVAAPELIQPATSAAPARAIPAPIAAPAPAKAGARGAGRPKPVPVGK